MGWPIITTFDSDSEGEVEAEFRRAVLEEQGQRLVVFGVAISEGEGGGGWGGGERSERAGLGVSAVSRTGHAHALDVAEDNGNPEEVFIQAPREVHVDEAAVCDGLA